MVVLKKLKASTLVETIVASVIILLVFGISSSIINQVYKTTLNNDKSKIDYQIDKLLYQYEHNAVLTPYKEEFDTFILSLEKDAKEIIIEAISLDGKQSLKNIKMGCYE